MSLVSKFFYEVWNGYRKFVCIRINKFFIEIFQEYLQSFENILWNSILKFLYEFWQKMLHYLQSSNSMKSLDVKLIWKKIVGKLQKENFCLFSILLHAIFEWKTLFRSYLKHEKQFSEKVHF